MTGWRDQQAVDAGLIDGILRRSEVDRILHDKIGIDQDEKLNTIDISRYFAARMERLDGGGDDQVAVLIAEGGIVDGAGDLGNIGDKKYVNEIEKLADDDNVKAVVLRVNSGGGSASSSENIWYAIEQLKETGKPVVVSMGDYAASGGYYIAAGADSIYAEPTTITGSIGVFLTFPIVRELTEDKIGVSFDTVNTARNANAFSPFREMGEEEKQLLTSRTQGIYATFLDRVATGRGIPIERIREIAGGRVYSGERAREIGLIDHFGGLDAAVASAARLAGLEEDYAVGHYPRLKPQWERFLEEILGADDDNQVVNKVVKSQLGAEELRALRAAARSVAGAGAAGSAAVGGDVLKHTHIPQMHLRCPQVKRLPGPPPHRQTERKDPRPRLEVHPRPEAQGVVDGDTSGLATLR